jgi:hypothetical protein
LFAGFEKSGQETYFGLCKLLLCVTLKNFEMQKNLTKSTNKYLKAG